MRTEQEIIGLDLTPEAMAAMEREIVQSERAYQRLSKGVRHNRDGTKGVTDEMDEIYWVDRVEALARRITRNNQMATQLVRREIFAAPGVRYVHEMTSLGEAIMLTIREAIPLIERAYPECQRRGRATDDCPSAVSTSDEDEWDEDLIVEFNPHITVLLRACQKARPALSWYLLDRAAASEAPVRKALDQLVAFVRRVCRSHKFKRLEMNFTRNEKANFRDYCKFMASKFEEHSRLLISRVDLYITPVGGRWMSRATSNRCMRRFLRALREGRIVPGVKAWICKRERGFRRGIHCHLLVAMDGHEHQKAGHYAQLLGEAWEQRFSDQCGSYFNCWARRYDYPLNCLGSVHIRDRKMLMGLREAIRYLTKESCQMRTGFARNLFRSQSSWSKGARKRGAPRKAEHDMTLVNEILGFA